MLSKLGFLTVESFRSLFRARVPVIISSITIFITLMIFSISYFGYINLRGYTFDFRKQFRIDVFFTPDLDRNASLEIFNTILLIDGIEKGDFIDRERAAEIFKSHFNRDVVDIIGTNPLPMGGIYEVAPQYRDVAVMARISDQIRLIPGVDLTLYQSGLIHRINTIIDNMLGFAFIVGGTILLISIIMVSNTIRLTIHAKRDDIATMRLLGASNIFIKLPFILEGLWQGMIGAFLSLVCLWVFYLLFQYMQESLKVYIIRPDLLITGNLIVGMILGLIGSYRGISKYLD